MDNQGYDTGNYRVSRDDLRQEDTCFSGGDSHCHYRVMAMSADHSYIMAPLSHSWDHLTATIRGIPEGTFIRIGFCFPLNSNMSLTGSHMEVETMKELMADTTGMAYFQDLEVGVVFRRFKGGQG